MTCSSALLAGFLAAALLSGVPSAAIADPPLSGIPTPGSTPTDRSSSLSISRAGTGTVISGAKLSFTGVGPRALAGTRVILMRRIGKGEWVQVGGGRVQPDGGYKARGVASGVGRNSWRFVATRSGGLNSSNTLNTTVFNWFFLADLAPVDYTQRGTGSIVIGGKAYTKSTYAGGTYSGQDDFQEYNLNYKCRLFDAWIGLGDESESEAVAEFAISRDGAESVLGSKTVGHATHVTSDVNHNFRLRTITRPTATNSPRGYWTFGNARVLCSRRP